VIAGHDDELVRIEHVRKSFGATKAVVDASLSIAKGRIHAVIGENGAGKSTLLKIAAGVLTPDEGAVNVFGKTLSPHTAREAIARGVAMVQQHFALIGVFTALENIALGVEPIHSDFASRVLGRIDLKVARGKVEAIARELGANIALDARVETLGVGDRQRLEIVRALYRDAKILILDEPTSVLTPDEANLLYAMMRRLADSGCAIVVVTHKLDEVRAHADDVTVMRKGGVILSRAMKSPGRASDEEMNELAEAAMGGEGAFAIASGARTSAPRWEFGSEALAVRDLKVGRAIDGVSISVRAGEVVGIAGVEGNGQRELVDVIAGTRAADAGSVFVVGKKPAAVVHEDRQREGLVLDASIADNVLLGDFARFTRFGVLDAKAMDREASRRLEAAHTSFDRSANARSLSGGNQQKIVIARALAQIKEGATTLVLAHPTRGVDLAASRSIHRDLLEAAKNGVAMLVVSADLNELRALSDRILVLARGKIVREFPPTTSDRDIGRAMLDVQI
jgi:ABC-type uncharacterized transport system ATPase subunit